MSMAATPHGTEGSLPEPVLHVALELGAKAWKVGFTPGLGRSPRTRTLAAGDLEGLESEIERAKRRFGLPEDVRVVCCHEAGRDGFWIHRELVARGLENHVVDSASIEVNRRKRRRKSDGLDLASLLRMLARYVGGEREVWKVVHVPSPEAEDRRHLHREIWTLTQERTERTNRIKSLLATQGVGLDLGGDFPRQLREARLPDGRPLGPELRARLEREQVRRQSVIEEINALEAERRVRAPGSVRPTAIPPSSRCAPSWLSGASASGAPGSSSWSSSPGGPLLPISPALPTLATYHVVRYIPHVIQSFRDTGTRDLFDRTDSRAARNTCPQAIWSVARRKLDRLNQAHILNDLRVPPGNRLEALRGNRRGQHSIRINDQYRVCFRWTESGPSDVEVTDYH